ncbi:MAG TPA: cupin domain-containing protein [Blastocatellia bacterium]|nr:cupin domain-containing protein [Blastocatellia bacterium]
MPFVDTSEVHPRSPLPGWSGRFIHSDNLTIVYWDAEDGAQPLHDHQHPQEEVWNVIDGEIEVTIEGATQVVGPGLVAIIPSGARHSVRVLRASRVIVVDHPKREPFGQEL